MTPKPSPTAFPATEPASGVQLAVKRWCDACRRSKPVSRFADDGSRCASCVARRGARPKVRSKTVGRRASRVTLAVVQAMYPEIGPDTFVPKTRGDCASVPRPCPFVSCKYHLALDIDADTGGMKINHPGTPVAEMVETCTLDVADRGGVILEDVASVMNFTRERVRQIEVKALAKPEVALAEAGVLDGVIAEADGFEGSEPPTDF